MKLTVQLQLLPDTDQAQKLLETVERFNEAANWLAGKAFEAKLANKFELQKRFYRDIREQFGIPADMAIRVIAQVVEAYKRDKTIRPVFRKHAAVPYTYNRNYSFKGLDRVSLSVVPSGRVVVPFVLGAYQKQQFGFAKGQADLVLRPDGKWFLLVTVDLPGEPQLPITDFVGVDLGIVNIVTTTEGESVSGAHIEAVRGRSARARQTFQRRGTRNSRRRLRKLSGRQSRFQKDVNHTIAKRLVAQAKALGKGLALENLKGIRTRTERTVGKATRRKLSNWSFFQLRQFITYKAELAGVPVVFVPPHNTSRTCSRCGHCDKANRPSQERFSCLSCHFTIHADQNGAANIRSRALGVFVNNPHLAVAQADRKPPA
jgi:IS605 OrfB family transposase